MFWSKVLILEILKMNIRSFKWSPAGLSLWVYLWKQCCCMVLQYSLCMSWYGSLSRELWRAPSVSHDLGHGSRFCSIAAAMPLSWGGMIWAPFAQYTLKHTHIEKMGHIYKSTMLYFSNKTFYLVIDDTLYPLSCFGLWEAVTMTPAHSPRCDTVKG